MEGLTRGQLAERAQINLETVRFYEQEGLLVPASRTASGYRKFQEITVDRLAFIKRAKTLGFSLDEIRELLVIQDEHTGACAEVRDLVRKKLAIVREKRAEIEKMEAHLSSALRRCNRALKSHKPQHTVETCPILRQMSDRPTASRTFRYVNLRRSSANGKPPTELQDWAKMSVL
jgi:MerR family mercuric resistance operon transcriptional regulator